MVELGDFDFANVDDLKPLYKKSVVLFENSGLSTKDSDAFAEFVNDKNEIKAEDQVSFVFRKIQYYLEVVLIFLKISNSKYHKVKLVLEHKQFADWLLTLSKISTVITKNRGAVYAQTLKDERITLDKLIKKFGA